MYSSAHDTHECRKGYATRGYVDVNGAVTQFRACGDFNCTVKRHGFAARDLVNHVTSAIRSPSKLPVEVLAQACRCMLFCGIVSAGWPRLLVFPGSYASSSSTPSLSCGPLQRPLAFPEVEGRWQWRSLRPLVLPSSWCSLHLLYAVHQTLSLWSLYSDSPLSSRPQPLGSGGDATLCEDTREDFGLSV